MPDPEKPFLTRLRPTQETLEWPDPDAKRVRKWVGQTDDGMLVELYVAVVRVAADDTEEWERGLGGELKDLGQLEGAYQAPRAIGHWPRAEGIDSRLVT